MKTSLLKGLIVICSLFIIMFAIGCSDDENPVVPDNTPKGITFSEKYGDVNSEICNSVLITSDNGYLMVGSKKTIGPLPSDIYVVKTDSLGDTLWTNTYGNYGRFESGYSVCEAGDGGYLIAGQAFLTGMNYGDLYLSKIESDGTLVWEKSYGGDLTEVGNSVITTSDGGILVAGCTKSFGVDSTDIYLVKTNSLGDSLWTKTIGGARSDSAISVCETTDGNYIITGQTSSYGAGGTDVYLVKIDSDGDTLWTNTIGGTSNEWGNSICATSDGGYVITGVTYKFGRDIYLIKTDANGDTLWTKTFGLTSNDNGYAVCEAEDGGYVLTGDIIASGNVNGEICLIKVDVNGNTVWNKSIGNSLDSRGHDVHLTEDGGFIVGGYTENHIMTGTDAYLVKTDANGNVE